MIKKLDKDLQYIKQCSTTLDNYIFCRYLLISINAIFKVPFFMFNMEFQLYTLIVLLKILIYIQKIKNFEVGALLYFSKQRQTLIIL